MEMIFYERIFRSFGEKAPIFTMAEVSKSKPIERCWDILEMHWNGSLLDSTDAVLGFAWSMTWKRKYPVVSLEETTYAKGVKLTSVEMSSLEAEVIRTPELEKRFVKIPRKRGRPPKT